MLAQPLTAPRRIRSKICWFLSILLILNSLTATAFAQFDSATVNGTVSDSGGAVVAGAVVNLRNVDLGTVLTRTTNSKGSYEFPDVQIGSYTVEVLGTGFERYETSPFNLVVGAHQKVDASLKVGSANESITVTVDNAGLQTESGEKSTTIESQEIIDLPLNGREYTDLALLTPGVQAGALQNGSVGQRRGSLVVNGNRSSANNYMLDGLDNNSYQIANQGFNNEVVTESVDAVQQYTVITSNFPAEYGRAGGAVVNVKTKSGSERPHFTAFEYLRNTVFDAYGPYFGNGQKPALVQNQFGGSVGYHVPHVKDFFFFADYEGLRQATHTVTSATIPTLDQRNGIFVGPRSTTDPTLIPVPVQNRLTGKQYPTGMIPQSDFTPFALAVLQALPAPTQINPTFGSNLVMTPGGHHFRDIGDVRLDKYFNSRITAFARFSKQSAHITAPSPISGPAGGGGVGHERILTTSGVAGMTVVLTKNSLLDLRGGITYEESGKVPYNNGISSFHKLLGIPYPVSPDLADAGLNTQAIHDFSALGVESTNDQFSNPHTVNIKANDTWSRGRHTFNFGYEWLHLVEDEDHGSPPLGEDTYDGDFSYYAGSGRPATSVARTQAYGLTDFIFGARNEYLLGKYAVTSEYYDFHYAYAEDSWKVFPKLTLTYGLRYEFAIPQRSQNSQLSNFDPATASLILSKPGSIVNQSLVNPRFANFAPRFGFAYSLYPNIVVRGGYGLSYIQWNRDGGEASITGNYPNSIDGDIVQSPTTQPLCANGSQDLTCFRPTMQGYPLSMISLGSYNTADTAVRYLPRANVPGYIQSYSLGTQTQLDKGTIVRIAYVGSHGVHVRVFGDYNQAAIQKPGVSLTLAQRRPVPTFGNIYWAMPVGFLRYNSLQTQVTHRATGGLFFINSFTFSKAIDNASGDLEAAHGDSAFVNVANVKGDSGISGYNQKLNDSFSAVWRIPYGARLRNHALRQLTSGWTLTTITRMTSGLPINVTYDPAGVDEVTGLGYSERPNYTGHLYTIVKPHSQWIVTSAGYTNVLDSTQVQIPVSSASAPAGTTATSPFGNMPRNALVGPGYVNVDFGFQKNFSLPEKMNLQFRTEAFNLLNHTNFKTPNTDRSSGSFGTYSPGSGVYPSRELQLALRLSY